MTAPEEAAPSSGRAAARPGYSAALAAAALSYAVLHHLGLLPDGLGSGPEGTRWADWLDLLVPWLVLAPAALALRAAPATPWVWALFGAGVVAYASGHGLHLAANSVNNAAPGATAHLWDEPVSHHVWFAGVALVVAAVAATMAGRPHPAVVGHLLALGLGVTWATNAVGGGTVAFSLLVALAGAAYGWARRGDLRAVLLVASLSAVLLLVGHLVQSG